MPSLDGYTFSPTNITVSNLQSNLVNQNFVATKIIIPPVPPVDNPDLKAIMDELKTIEAKEDANKVELDQFVTKFNQIFK